MEFLGKMVKKEFKGFGVFDGVVDSYDSSTGFFKILYEDGDFEEAEFSEVARLVSPPPISSSGEPIPERENVVVKRVGRKPKKRRQNCRDPGKSSENLSADCDLELKNLEGTEQKLGQNLVNEICASASGNLSDNVLDLNRGFNFSEVAEIVETRGCIDLNLTVVNDEFDEGLGNGKKERCFDLNLGLSDDNSNGVNEIPGNDLQNGGGIACRSMPESLVDANHVNSNRASEIKLEASSPDVIAPSPCEDGNSGRRKRRKVARTLTSPTETVLRRSARRAKAMALNECDSSMMMSAEGVNDLSMSGVTDESEEKLSAADLERPREPWVLPPKIELPLSSTNLNLEGVPVLDLFSVYSCLRSFSTLLYLSPFGLEDLVAALKSRVSNLLIDFVHVSILQTLRKHLEFLANEGCESASTCLRNLDWDLLDVITWPIFMVEYLLIHGSGLKPGLSLDRLNLFDGEYYSQPANVKLELLRCLCDDVIEVEAIRSELSKRMIMADATMEMDRTMSSDICRKRRMSLGARGDSNLNEDMLEQVADGNSDECCLCKMDGNLICCDGCPAAYHTKCVGIVGSLLPEGDWYCPECMIGRANLGAKPRTLIRGAELLGTDPYGRLYFSCFDYLLVSDSYDAESSFNYYHKEDLGAVIQLLRSTDILNESILSAIAQQWAIPTNMCEPKCDLESKNCITGTLDGWKISSTSKCTMEMENPHTSSEGSAEVLQSKQLIPNSMRPGSPEIAGQATVAKSISTAKQGKRNRGRPRSVPKAKEENVLPGHFGDVYINSYSFARTASSIVEELLRKRSEKVNADLPKTEEEIISIQLKFILRKSTKFCWPTIQGLDVDRQKENCGWCYCCRFPVEGRECLFSFLNRTPVAEGLKAEVDAVLSKKKKGHLIDVICCMLYMEQRLRGLLLGPWLSPHYYELWRKDVLKASDVSSLKRPLLMLESNLYPSALSPDWWKHIDSVKTMGSSSHFVASSRATSKSAINRKKGKYGDSEIKSLIAAGGLGLFWWRGGKISRSLFNWKVVPRALALKAARKAGRIKIPGIQYPDGSENAKRSKCLAWRAAVETSTSLEQLALLVRELDMFLRWDDIENTHPHFLLDKESIKSIRLFKKAIIRRKCVEGTQVKYLIDFGKRRCIPDVVIKHGIKLEDDSGEKKKYWLGEPYVPLYLLKSFEERRITRKASKTNSSKFRKGGRVTKKPSREKGFDYLFSRAEKADSYQCGHCNKHVPISEAVSCQHCNGFFHKRHVTKSSEAITSASTYTCHRCRAGKRVKTDSMPGKRKWGKLQDAKNLKVVRRGRPPKLRSTAQNGKALANRGVVLSGKNKKAKAQYHKKSSQQENANVYSGMTLRRSARNAAYVPVQPKSAAGGKKKKRKRNKSRKVAVKEIPKSSSCQKENPKNSSCQKRRTRVVHSFWINGLLLSKKPNDERVVQFKRRKLLRPSDFSAGNDDPPKCSLCSEHGPVSASMYIACEICGDWFHGDAFGLNEANIGSLIGFKCHVCREKSPPVCPFCDLSRDASEFGTQSAQESQEIRIQKETDNVMEICPDVVSPGLLEIETVENLDGELQAVDDSGANVDYDKSPVLDPELRAENWSSDSKLIIANAIESPILDSGAYLLTDCAQELHSDEVSLGQFDVQMIQNSDRTLTQDTNAVLDSDMKEENGSTDSKEITGANVDYDKSPVLDPELRAENWSSDSKLIIANAIESPNLDSGAYLLTDCAQELHSDEVSLGQFDVQMIQNSDRTLTQDMSAVLDSDMKEENGSTDSKEITANTIESEAEDKVDLSTGHVCFGDVSLGSLEVQTVQDSVANLDQVETPFLDPELRVEMGSPVCGKVISNVIETQSGDKADLYRVEEYCSHDVSLGRLEDQTVQIFVGNLDQVKTPGFDPGLRVENGSPASKEAIANATESQNRDLNSDFSTDRGQELQCDSICLGFSKVHTAQSSGGNLDQMRTLELDSELRLENGSPASKEGIFNAIESQSWDLKTDLSTAFVQESHCDDVSPSRLDVQIDQNSVEKLHQVKTPALDSELRVENGLTDSKEVVSNAVESQKGGLEADE